MIIPSCLYLQPFQWNAVILRYDGSSLSAAIGDVSKTIYVEGTLTRLYIYNFLSLTVYAIFSTISV